MVFEFTDVSGMRWRTSQCSTIFPSSSSRQIFPNEATESLGDRTVGLGVAEARDEPAIYDREDGAFRLHRRPIFMSFRGLQAQS
jgi:hypothetical protein